MNNIPADVVIFENSRNDWLSIAARTCAKRRIIIASTYTPIHGCGGLDEESVGVANPSIKRDVSVGSATSKGASLTCSLKIVQPGMDTLPSGLTWCNGAIKTAIIKGCSKGRFGAMPPAPAIESQR